MANRATANLISSTGGKTTVTATGNAKLNVEAAVDPQGTGTQSAEANLIKGSGAIVKLSDSVEANVVAGGTKDDEAVLDFAHFLKCPGKADLEISWADAKALVGELKDMGIRKETALLKADSETLEELKKLKTITGQTLRTFLKYVNSHKKQ